MNVDGKHFRTIWVKEDDSSTIQIIDQQKLPHEFIIMDLPTVEDFRSAIKDMYVRGAGLIGATAGYGMYIAALTAPEDSFDNMKKVSDTFKYPFPYLLDTSQEVAKNFGAVCTPDIFGMDNQAILKYRGRLDSTGSDTQSKNLPRELVNAMYEMVHEGKITQEQIPSMGCSIKWI